MFYGVLDEIDDGMGFEFRTTSEAEITCIDETESSRLKWQRGKSRGKRNALTLVVLYPDVSYATVESKG